MADHELEETNTKSSKQEPTPFISETTGINRNDIATDIESTFISELKDQFKGSADGKDESSLPCRSRLYIVCEMYTLNSC